MNKVVHSTLLTVALAIAAYGLLAVFSGGGEVLGAINSLPLQVWSAILGLSLFNYLLRYLRWHLYITHNHPLAIGHGHHLAIYVAGFSLTMTPGKAGEAMRSLYLKPYGVSHQRSIGALFVERILDLVAVLALAGLGVVFLDGNEARVAAVVTLLLIGGCLLVVKMPRERVLQSRWVQRLPEKLQRLVLFVESMLANANEFLSLRLLLIGLGIGLAAWFCEAYGLFLVMEEFRPGQSEMTLGLAIYGMAILIGAISFLPGGLGGSEATMILLLVQAGFGSAEAVAITMICRIATLWFAVAIGMTVLFFMTILRLAPAGEP